MENFSWSFRNKVLILTNEASFALTLEFSIAGYFQRFIFSRTRKRETVTATEQQSTELTSRKRSIWGFRTDRWSWSHMRVRAHAHTHTQKCNEPPFFFYSHTHLTGFYRMCDVCIKINHLCYRSSHTRKFTSAGISVM